MWGCGQGYEQGEVGEKSGQSIWKNGFMLVGCIKDAYRVGFHFHSRKVLNMRNEDDFSKRIDEIRKKLYEVAEAMNVFLPDYNKVEDLMFEVAFAMDEMDEMSEIFEQMSRANYRDMVGLRSNVDSILNILEKYGDELSYENAAKRSELREYIRGALEYVDRLWDQLKG